MITLGTIAIGVMCPLVGLYLLYGGDWAAMLWDLKEILDVVLVVAGVVALFFPLTAPFVIAIAALSVLALAVSATLYATQAPNPQTGETVGLGDVLWSAAGVAFSGASSLKALRAVRGTGHVHTDVRDRRAIADDVRQLALGAHGRPERHRRGAQTLGIRMLPLAPGTSLRHRARRGRPDADRGRWRSLARRAPSTATSSGPARCRASPTRSRDAVGLNPIQGPNPDVFTGIAERERFNQPWHWNNGILPGGHELHIVPAN